MPPCWATSQCVPGVEGAWGVSTHCTGTPQALWGTDLVAGGSSIPGALISLPFHGYPRDRVVVPTTPLQRPPRAPGVSQSPVLCPGPWSRGGAAVEPWSRRVAAAAAAICLGDVLFMVPGTRGGHGARGAPVSPQGHLRDRRLNGGREGPQTPPVAAVAFGIPPCVAPGVGAGRERPRAGGAGSGPCHRDPAGCGGPRCATGVSPAWLQARGCRAAGPRTVGAGGRQGGSPALGVPVPPWRCREADAGGAVWGCGGDLGRNSGGGR